MRYSNSANVQAWLTKLGINFTTDYPDAVTSLYVQQAEDEIDRLCGRVFNMRRYNETMNGNGSSMLILKHTPVVCINSIVVRYYPLSVVRTFKDNDGYIIIDRKIGKVGIRPSFALQQAWPEGMAQQYAYIFARGDNNVNVQYWSGFNMIGGNKSFDEIGNTGFYDIMDWSTDVTNQIFTLPFTVGNVGWKMIKGADTATIVDDTANWTQTDSKTYKCLLANFDSSSWYRLVYVPQAVMFAATLLASCNLLASIGARPDGIGGVGVQSHSVGGFSESFGDLGKYGPQIKQWRQQATDMLKWYMTNTVSIGR